jgi:hypothetical protein
MSHVFAFALFALSLVGIVFATYHATRRVPAEPSRRTKLATGMPPPVDSARGPAMAPTFETRKVTAGPSHVPTGAVLLAIELSQFARGVRGLDVLRRSVDRASPA